MCFAHLYFFDDPLLNLNMSTSPPHPSQYDQNDIINVLHNGKHPPDPPAPK